jgi:hypothetical protein
LRADDDLLLGKLELQPLSQGLPVGVVKALHHDFDHGYVVFLGRAAAFPETLSRAPHELVAPPNLSVRFLKNPSNHSLLMGRPLPVFFGRRICTRCEGPVAHDAFRSRILPGQLSRSVCVVTVSTCLPKRFM